MHQVGKKKDYHYIRITVNKTDKLYQEVKLKNDPLHAPRQNACRYIVIDLCFISRRIVLKPAIL